jgi:hypothetical protein
MNKIKEMIHIIEAMECYCETPEFLGGYDKYTFAEKYGEELANATFKVKKCNRCKKLEELGAL